MSSGINEVGKEIHLNTSGNKTYTQTIKTPKLNRVPSNENNIKNNIKSRELKPQEIKKIIEKINENVGRLTQDVKFSYSETLKSLIVKVIDAKTGQVIREIPPKEVINLQKKLSEVVGIIFDSKEVER